MTIKVIKRDGSKEPLDIEKIHRVCEWACEGLEGVSISELEIVSQLQFFNNMKTSDIQETLIKSAGSLISEQSPNYQYVAGRLVNYALRKMVWNSHIPPKLSDHIQSLVSKDLYTIELLQWFNLLELDQLDSYIKHDRDFDIVYAGMEQFREKYLVQNRVTKKVYETPQFAYMLIAATLFHDYPKSTRLQWIKDYYDAISTFEINLPTPIMAGVRTSQKQFASCVLIDCDDSLESISSVTRSIIKYVSKKAGIGVNLGRIRALGQPIRNGDAYHTGVTPFVKLIQAAVKSCSQGGVRGGAATVYFPIWHYEIENILVLKNNKGTDDNRARHLDYGIQFNKLMYERLLAGKDITLFSPESVPGLYEAFFNNQELFEELYTKAEADKSIRKQTIPAYELFGKFVQERMETSRVYLMNVDHVNTHGPFLEREAPIFMSNLCAEVVQPTVPITETGGEISTCILSAMNIAAPSIKKPSDLERPCRLAVRALNQLIDYQDYPEAAAERNTKKLRPLGIGIINLAYFLAKNKTSYSNPDLELIHEWMEAYSYYIIKASVELAKERRKSIDVPSKYLLGILPIDTYKKEVDELVSPNYKLDWESLREDLHEYGIMNGLLMALMPSETSSQTSNATNGVEPIRSYVTTKISKDGALKQAAPELNRYKKYYEPLWTQESPEGYLHIMAVIQKFIDQSISTNTSYNPQFFEDNKLPMSMLLKDLITCYKYGIKTLYYFNAYDGATDELGDEDCASCKI